MAMVDDLTQAVGHTANLSPGQAALAVGSMLRFLAARLPSPLFGELQARLSAPSTAGGPASAPDSPTVP
jgi:hypothetical protein